MGIRFSNSRKGDRQSLEPANTGSGLLMQRIPQDILRCLRKVNWTKVWRIKQVSKEEVMIEALQQLVREFEEKMRAIFQQPVKEFEEKMMAIFQQLVKESADLKNEVRELQRDCETLRTERTTVKAENLKLKSAIMSAGETMRDFLQAIVAEVNEPAAEEKDASQEGGGTVT
jgi:predicted  nucleic acid-binding Zn-ribbon protein